MDDLTRALFRFFGPASGICLPPVPEECREGLVLLPPATFTTCSVDPKALYLFTGEAKALLLAPPAERPDLTVSLFGHGINSYAWTLRLRRPGLRVLAQVAYGGAYMEAEEQAREVTKMFQDVHALQKSSPALPDALPDGRDLVLLRSPFRDLHGEGPAPAPGVTPGEWLERNGWRGRRHGQTTTDGEH